MYILTFIFPDVLKVSYFWLQSVGHWICENRWKEASLSSGLEAKARTRFFFSTDFSTPCQISKDFCKIRNRFWGLSWPWNELWVAQRRFYSLLILVNTTPTSAYADIQKFLTFFFFFCKFSFKFHFLLEITCEWLWQFIGFRITFLFSTKRILNNTNFQVCAVYVYLIFSKGGKLKPHSFCEKYNHTFFFLWEIMRYCRQKCFSFSTISLSI